MSIRTIQEGKDYLRQNWQSTSGAICPCCKQTVKLYRRKLNAQMAYSLILIYRHYVNNPQTVWLDLNDFLLTRGVNSGESNAALLRHWGLIERKPELKQDGNRAGLYSITTAGRLFVESKVRVKKYTYFYNNKIYRPDLLDTETIGIQEALGSKFNYSELMQGI